METDWIRNALSMSTESANIFHGYAQEINIFLGYALDYKSENAEKIDSVTRVEAGSNTSTVTLRVVGGDEKGSLKSEAIKYGRES
jgi:hypothetical protein